MEIEDTIRTVIGIIGSVTSIHIFLSPASIINEICKWRSTLRYSGFQYHMKILICALSVLYGLPFVKPNSIIVSNINGIGLAIHIMYITMFLKFCKDKETRMINMVVIVLITLFLAAVALSSLLIFHTDTERYTIVGAICIFFNVLMCSSSLNVMRAVIQEKSVIYINPYLSLTVLANGLIWIAYGAIHFDIIIVLPNGLEAGFAACELFVYAVYYSRTQFPDDDQRAAIEMNNSGAGLKIIKEKLH
ncbi:hypothetical protein SUGI_1111220 [Cryptomeria japonica]|uniref:putative bidirectional sugar transporter SWEET7d n=1 Tax=Cryptomeria japonica TaxID=3369 RepID=UPI0024148641|nr:putative bidirectional sugar transporter SWEET7d [Cryptomeria japonica]XP_057868027.1 putative bidirectional sugar transporter SWEET7d [Cryptomeria japonica]GLJ52237.1 hypothetical protein SUGI_1111220 [Cryptomeria japonica]